MENINLEKLGIIGGGAGGLELLKLFRRSPAVRVQFVCDKNAEAPACKEALLRKIPVITEIKQLTDFEVDYLIDITGSTMVSELIHKYTDQTKIKIIPNEVAYFLFNVLTTLQDENYEDSMRNRFLIFNLHNEDFGIEIACVTEIVKFQKITEVPDVPEFIRGIINLRGKVIPVVDMRKRFKFPGAEISDRTCVVVTEIEGKNFGLVVDYVQEVLNIPEEHISQSANFSGVNSKFVRGFGRVAESVKVLLNLNEVLNFEELNDLNLSLNDPQAEVV